MAEINYKGIKLPDGNSYQTAGEYVPYSSTVSTPISDASVQNLAPEYDPTSTYSVKDWCVYNGVLYQCNTAIATPEAFDSTKWVAKKIVDMTGSDIPVSSSDSTSVADKIDDIEDNTIYKDGTYNLSGICFGYGSGSSGNPNGIFYLPKIIPANKTVTITNPSITLCKKYDGSNVAQTTATASYNDSQKYVAVGGNVSIGYYVSCIMSVAFTITIS